MARGATIGHHCRGVARPPGLGAAKASGRAGRRRARDSRDGVAGRRGVASPDKGDVCMVEPDDVTSHEPSDVAARPLYGPGGNYLSRPLALSLSLWTSAEYNCSKQICYVSQICQVGPEVHVCVSYKATQW